MLPRSARPHLRLASLSLLVLSPLSASADSWPLGSTAAAPATLEQARAVLTARDEFVQQLSPFDRAVRMQTDQPTTEAQFLRHMGAAARAWTPDELERLEAAIGAIDELLQGWDLNWPEPILLVKISGEVDGGAAYTRGATIALPPQKLALPDAAFERLLLHELFHVLSRHNPKLRDQLYAIVGFQPCGPVELPPSMRERAITNPDAPLRNWCAELTIDGRPVHVVPILFSETDYDPQRDGTLFDYLVFRLLVVEEQGDRWAPVLENGEPVLLDGRRTPAYFDLIGRNTQYIIHPEEVLADNFVLLMQGEQAVPTPRILAEMEKLLRK